MADEVNLDASRALAGDSRRLPEAIMEYAPGLIVMTDDQDRIVLFNRACEELTGYTRAEVIGKTIRDCLLPLAWGPVYEKRLADMAASEESELHQVAWRTKLGEERLIEWRRIRLDCPEYGGPCILSAGVDVTERNRLRAQLLQSQSAAPIQSFAGALAHDFSKILKAINQLAETGLSHLPPGHPARAALQDIRRFGERGIRLSRRLLAVARNQPLELKQFALNECVSELAKLLLSVMGEKIDLELDLANDVGAVLADSTQIEEVLMNLCVNARDAMPDGGKLTVRTENAYLDDVACSARPGLVPGKYVILTVMDTGRGMSPETLRRAFEPFFTAKPPGEGTGLGLAVVDGIVKQHGGMVMVESAVGMGTTFKVYLPAAAEIRKIDTPPPQQVSGPRLETILVAEDESPVRRLIVSVLESKGYRVLAAADGGDALRLLESAEGEVDLVLSDVVMPKIGGRELYESIHPRKPKLKFLFMSGYAGSALGEDFIKNEGVILLKKPFTAPELARKIREILDRRD